MTNVLVTGGSGQLANCIKDVARKFPKLNLIFKSSLELDITDFEKTSSIFKSQNIDYCINCAAYTDVDNAEQKSKKAMLVNCHGPKNISIACLENDAVLIHVSTDFVFDGYSSIPYKEEDLPNPLGIYGLSKFRGETAIKEHLKKFFIFRTSWLYSEHNKNFMKTMIQLSKSKKKLSVVDDQIGTPTYARDLAKTMLKIIDKKNKKYGTYHYSNEGVASWYDFAYAIFKEIESEIELCPIKSKDYLTSAKRPYFSVLDKSKIKMNLDITIPHWRSSLNEAIINLRKEINL
ncbi:dTDP-4-dehydrorhamnose reductase [Winogradskyella flava]|uniref:dTDP-4-dehydrorhamnose reductase n=1 Tax=Winogradskyella flava TaxID=1884876 RepID=A0A842IMI6_9FLAO|nr:dTDP-4-dehydrorhamnose reductase [Winogradskyella flava]MBC2843865.1 dTDP-4-dehydrorhamnose reductase [Winogradskyella flava]